MSFVEIICGIDEAGRGPLAGPVVAAAVILDPARPIDGLNDSKQLTEEAPRHPRPADPGARHRLGRRLGQRRGDRQASTSARPTSSPCAAPSRQLGVTPDACARRRQRPAAARAARSPASSAATRWSPPSRPPPSSPRPRATPMMVDLCAQYPGYGFSQHKGYGSAAHLEALRTPRPQPGPRRTSRPLRTD